MPTLEEHAENFCQQEIDRLAQFLRLEVGATGPEGTPVVDTAIAWIRSHKPPETTVNITQLLDELDYEYCDCGEAYTLRHMVSPSCQSCQTKDLRRDASAAIKQLIQYGQVATQGLRDVDKRIDAAVHQASQIAAAELLGRLSTL